jgi:Ca-activated chloride channel family protein
MIQPTLEFVPLTAAVPYGVAASLDVLLRIHSPRREDQQPIPPLNLAIVLDRSGSMAGEKLEYAKAAARQAVSLLGPNDLVNLVTFDDEVETVASGAGASDAGALLTAIAAIEAGGSTALHGGWARGVSLLQAPAPGSISRVLLVSDGQANVGERRPALIGRQVERETSAGISTSTLGVGRDFNEDLLEAMARRGDGEYHFVESPAQLPAIFAAELRSMTRTFGRRCSLEVRAADGVRVLDVLNDLDRLPNGRLMLPNLVQGRTVEVLIRLEVGPSSTQHRSLLQVRLAWDLVDGGERQKVLDELALPVVAPEVFAAMPSNPAVHEQALLLETARIKDQAVEALDRGDSMGAQSLLGGAMRAIKNAPHTKATEGELSQLLVLMRELESNDIVSTRKHTKSQSYVRRRSRSDPEPGDLH